jgi:hypothetical protein
MIKILSRINHSQLSDEQIKEPFLRRVEESLQRENFHSAVAFLNSAIHLLPHDLDLYFYRAQILHFGCFDCGKALRDYRHIMNTLATEKDHPLFAECRIAIGDMMNLEHPAMKS